MGVVVAPADRVWTRKDKKKIIRSLTFDSLKSHSNLSKFSIITISKLIVN